MIAPPRPWWYSGDDDVPGDDVPGDEVSSDEVSGDGAPGDGAPGDGAPGETPPEAAGTSSGLDWLSLLSSAQRMVDWAAEKVMTPHADHDDPAQYPDCVVCRTLVLIGPSSPGTGPVPDPEPPHQVDPIEWIPIRDAGTDAVTAG